LNRNNRDRLSSGLGIFESVLEGAAAFGIVKRKTRNRRIILHMATIHISEAEAASDFAGLMARVRAGAEVVIESDARAVAVVRPAGDQFRPRLLSESIALAKKHAEERGYEPRMDPQFAADLEEIIRNRKPWNPPAWE
jgi:antitoxin (DNA-binding transcriptional repressor) of toxin-antitoxin stability system